MINFSRNNYMVLFQIVDKTVYIVVSEGKAAEILSEYFSVLEFNRVYFERLLGTCD